MELEKEDLEVLANETIEDDILRPLRLSFIIYTSIFLMIAIGIFWSKSLIFLISIGMAIIIGSLIFHLLVFRYEENIVRNFMVRIQTFQLVDKLAKSCGVNSNEFKLVSHVGFRETEDPREWLAEDDSKGNGQ